MGLPAVPPLHADYQRNPYNPPACDSRCPTCFSRCRSEIWSSIGGAGFVKFLAKDKDLAKLQNLQIKTNLRREVAWNSRFHLQPQSSSASPLATYSSLQDKHLVGYFNNTRMKKHLRRAGLVTRRGELVTESTYRLNMARKEHQRHVRDLMAQAIVHKTLDLERQRQADIKQKLEEIAKVELVRRVRMDRGRKGDEDITQYLSPRGRPKSAYNSQSRQPQPPRSGGRPSTAPARQRPSSKRAGVVYVDQDGFPVHRESARSDRSDTSSNGEVDSPALRELDPKILHRISLNLRPDEKEGLSPYSPDVTPRPPGARSKGQRSPRTKTGGGVVSKNGRGYRPRSNKGSLALHRKEPAYPHATQLQSMCDVTVRYRGTGLKLQYEREDKRDEIQVYQQHCGGENLVVFQGFAEKGNDLIFVSRRHRGYPFSVTFFVNRVQVLRLSACCEYKYTPGALLGGSKGHFKFIGVHGSSPCYKCLVEAEFARRERQRYKDVQTDTIVPEPEPEPEHAGMSTQTEPQEDEEDEGRKEESTQMEEEANDGYEDDEFEEDEEQKDDEDKEEKDYESDGFSSEAENEKESIHAEDKKTEDKYGDSDFEVESEKEEEEKEDVVEEVEEDEDEKSDLEVDSEKEVEEEKEEEVVPEEKYGSDSEQSKSALEEVEETFQQEDVEEVKDEPEEKEDDKEEERSLFSASEGDNRLLSSDEEDEDKKSLLEGQRNHTESEADFKISSSADEDEKEEEAERQTLKDSDDEKVEDEKEDKAEVKEDEGSDRDISKSARDEVEETEEVLEESLTLEVTAETEVDPPPQEAVLVQEGTLVRENNEDDTAQAEEQTLDENTVEQEAQVERDQVEKEDEKKEVSPQDDDAGNARDAEDTQSVQDENMPVQSSVEPEIEQLEETKDDASEAQQEDEKETMYSAPVQDHAEAGVEANTEREDPRPEEQEVPEVEQEDVEQTQDIQSEDPVETQQEGEPLEEGPKDEADPADEGVSQEAQDSEAQQEVPLEDTVDAPVDEPTQDIQDRESEQGITEESAQEKEENEEKINDSRQNKEEMEEEQEAAETVNEKEEEEKKDAEKDEEKDEEKGEKKEKEDGYRSDSSSSSSSSDSEDEEKQKLKLSGFIQEQATDSKPDNTGIPDQSHSNNKESPLDNDQSYSRLALNMNEKSLGSDQAEQIAQALLEDPKYKSIEYLLLRANPLEDKGISAIMQSLITLHHQIPEATEDAEEQPKTGIKLTHLDLGDTKITNKGAVDVADFLKLPTNITNVNLSDNSLGRSGCKALAAGLRCNKSLSTLSIEYASLGDSGCREIIEAIRDHPTLRELNLEGNGITDESARALLQLVKDNSVLTSINFVRDNQVTQELAEEIEEILKTGEFIW